jgi:hypothetical protein
MGKNIVALLPAFRESISTSCAALFEKVYKQFLTNFQRTIYFPLQQLFASGVPL